MNYKSPTNNENRHNNKNDGYNRQNYNRQPYKSKKRYHSPFNQKYSKEEFENVAFALDIGTRSVVGILGANVDGVYRVMDSVQVFHTERAMRDGQIEDIEQVSKIIGEVKSALEKKHDIRLKSVSIAAAGRALKTKKVVYEQEINPNEEITPKLMQAVEYCALGIAQGEFAENDGKESEAAFYCVGYSVINYSLDGYDLSALIGHMGKKIKVELIAAFLPQNVVQSLYSVTGANGLTVDNLTLEPIAAINVVVPKDVQLLNIALVDIGAGTSDIAISKNGSIFAYDMVTVAGDEITEAIMKKCLTSFEVAEEIKLRLDYSDEPITYTNILGAQKEETKGDILEGIQEAISDLAKAISDGILAINEEPPSAVFLVGGGSQTPGLCEEIADYLKLPLSNVAISGNQPFKNIELYSQKLQSPEFITPIGIGNLSYSYKGCDFFSTTVNDKKIMLLNTGRLRVMDALLLSSIKPQSMIGLSSRPLIFKLNGERKVYRGESAIPGEIYVNGNIASIDSPIRHGDKITAKPAINGKPVAVTVDELAKELKPIAALIDGEDVELKPEFFKNGERLNGDYSIQSGDDITYSEVITVGEVLNQIGAEFTETIGVNGEPASLDALIYSGDYISLNIPPEEKALSAESESARQEDNLPTEEIIDEKEVGDTVYADTEEIKEPTTKEDSTEEPYIKEPQIKEPQIKEPQIEEPQIEEPQTKEPEIKETETKEPETKESKIEEPSAKPKADKIEAEGLQKETVEKPLAKANTIMVTINGEDRLIEVADVNKVFFFDMLNYVDIDPNNPQGNITLRHNGQSALYSARIKSGDVIEIFWEK